MTIRQRWRQTALHNKLLVLFAGLAVIVAVAVPTIRTLCKLRAQPCTHEAQPRRPDLRHFQPPRLNQTLSTGVGRFWLRRTSSGWRINPHAVVGTIIHLGTLVFFGLVFYHVYLDKHLPNNTTLTVFYATMGPFSLWYVVHQNWVLLLRIWEHPLGKLFYGILASLIVTVSKVGGDQEIRLLTQSNPSLFPSAQQALTVFNIIAMILTTISIILLLISMAQLCLSTLPFRRPFTRIFAFMWSGIFIMTVPFPFINGDFSVVGLKPFDPTEELLLLSSFIRNDRFLAGSDRVCINLPPGAFVSPFSTRDPIPNQVVMAQPISAGPDRLGHSYTFRVVECLKFEQTSPKGMMTLLL